jgi:hypothetical protein
MTDNLPVLHLRVERKVMMMGLGSNIDTHHGFRLRHKKPSVIDGIRSSGEANKGFPLGSIKLKQ